MKKNSAKNGKTKESLPKVRFNHELKAVEVMDEDHHFLLSALPSMHGTYGAAKWMERESDGWLLPSEEIMGIIHEHLKDINETLLSNDYPTIETDGEWWIDECHIAKSLIDVSWAKYCRLRHCYTYQAKIEDLYQFRLIKIVE